MGLASKVAARTQQHDWHAAKCRWTAWLHDGPCKGLGRQHRLSRCATGWIPAKLAPAASVDDDTLGLVDDVEGVVDGDVDALRCSDEVPLGMQQAVDAEAAGWAKIWQQGVWPTCLGEVLPPFEVQDLHAACLTFPCRVGLG